MLEKICEVLKWIVAGLGILILGYGVIRIWTIAICRSYFEVKERFERRKKHEHS